MDDMCPDCPMEENGINESICVNCMLQDDSWYAQDSEADSSKNEAPNQTV
ncbi:hypothetical protein LJC56_11280 [Christensenellaceae bacterium OttesenSCG-928-K19]|nr:hypothetical protein [Christensenellaceae bacterium OttesenSCG-928-K19]